MRRPMIVAHRGASCLAHENTVAAFAKAIALGADMIELDVRRTKDRVLIVYHDPDIGGRPIGQLTHREANDLAAARNFVIPALEEVLALTRGKIRLDAELKETGYEREVVGLILKYFKYGDFVITSFHGSVITAVRKSFPAVKTGLVLGWGQPLLPLLCGWLQLFVGIAPRKSGAAFWALQYSLLKFGLLQRLSRRHQTVYLWTVDKPGLLAKFLADRRIQAVITNKPDLAIAIYQRRHAPSGIWGH